MGAKMIYIYEILERGAVTNRVVAEEKFMRENFSEYRLAEDHLSIVEEQVRKQRDSLLLSLVDPIAGSVLRWQDLSDEMKNAWTDYRLALLDVPQQPGFPTDVVWPTIPNFIKQTSEVIL